MAGLAFAVVFCVAEVTKRGPWRRFPLGRHEQPDLGPYWRWPTPDQIKNSSSTFASWGVATVTLVIGALITLIRFVTGHGWDELMWAGVLFLASLLPGFATFRFVVNESTVPGAHRWRRRPPNGR